MGKPIDKNEKSTDKSRQSCQRSPVRPKVIYKEDSEADVDETTDADSVSISSYGSTNSRRRGKKKRQNLTGFPSPKKKKKLLKPEPITTKPTLMKAVAVAKKIK